jgi:hypothetical protein
MQGRKLESLHCCTPQLDVMEALSGYLTGPLPSLRVSREPLKHEPEPDLLPVFDQQRTIGANYRISHGVGPLRFK